MSSAKCKVGVRALRQARRSSFTASRLAAAHCPACELGPRVAAQTRFQSGPLLNQPARSGRQPSSSHDIPVRLAPCRGLRRGPESKPMLKPARSAPDEPVSKSRFVVGGVQPARVLPRAWPNHSVNLRANGMPPGPSRRYAVHFPRLGPGVTPSSPGYLER